MIFSQCQNAMLVALTSLLVLGRAQAFVSPIGHVFTQQFTVSSQMPLSAAAMVDVNFDSLTVATSSVMESSAMLLAETEPWVQPLALVMGPTLNFLSFAMLCRVVASWYPNTNLNELPWAIIAWPTEPLLRVVKGQIPPAFGVDITPVFWLAIFTFINEILLGQQGLLTMKLKYGI